MAIVPEHGDGCFTEVAQIEMTDPCIPQRQKNRARCSDGLPVEGREILHEKTRAQYSVRNTGGADWFINHRVTATERNFIHRALAEDREQQTSSDNSALTASNDVQTE